MLAVVYLIFNQGYGGRGDLAVEALQLGRAMTELMPDEPEVLGLMALMLLHDARREARFQDDDLVLLADQDRSLWDTEQIADGRAVLDRALALGGRGPYVVQAAIASLHAEEPRDWPQIAALYGELAQLTGSPVVELSRAVAVAEADGGRRAWTSWTAWRWRTTTTCTRPGASCCAGWTERTKPATRTAARWPWCTTTPSDACSNDASPSSARRPTPQTERRRMTYSGGGGEGERERGEGGGRGGGR